LTKSISAIGKLDIVWLSGIGEKGHIQTSQLERTNPSSETIKILIEEIPTQVYASMIFKIKFRLINCSIKVVEPMLNFQNSQNQDIIWLGLSSKNLGKLEQSQSVELEMRLFPTKPGLYSIPLIKVVDLISKENYDYKELAFVNII